jgi:hypothetical protein
MLNTNYKYFLLDTCAFCRIGYSFQEIFDIELVYKSNSCKIVVHNDISCEIKSASKIRSKYGFNQLPKIPKNVKIKPETKDMHLFDQSYSLLDYTSGYSNFKSPPSTIDKRCLAMQLSYPALINTVTDDVCMRSLANTLNLKVYNSIELIYMLYNTKNIDLDVLVAYRNNLIGIDDWIPSFDVYLQKKGIRIR